jgi:hypothetical protein
MSTPPPKKFWTILNSSLFIWLLSLIFLSVAPFLWNQWKAHAEKEELLVKIDREIWSRFNQLTNISKRESDSATGSFNEKPSPCVLQSDTGQTGCRGLVDVKEIIFAFLMPPAQTVRPRFYAMYDEFASTSLLALLSQELVLESNPLQQDSLRRSLTTLETYRNIPMDHFVAPDQVTTIVNGYKRAMYLHQWDN